MCDYAFSRNLTSKRFSYVLEANRTQESRLLCVKNDA
jgi:hypothetical protein